MQCHTIDEALTSQPIDPHGAMGCDDRRINDRPASPWVDRLASVLGLKDTHDRSRAVWDTSRPGVDMSSRPFPVETAAEPEDHPASVDMISAPSDSKLAEALRAGDGAAIAQLFDLYGGHVERVLIRTIGRDAEMEDMVQDVFLGAYRSGPNYQGDDAQLKAWISRIAVFTARGYLRKRKRRWWLRSADPAQMPELSSKEPSPHTAEVLRRTHAALDLMDADLRIPFALREFEAMELAEIAEACDCSVSTIKRRLARARKTFDRLAKKDPILRDWLGDES
ncbi:ECF RNA polymerase sigma-E factor [Enhygromyxa salina]|uniref:ECF RNA polymerase sigma-E factor n=2 Tax=Enhygromyxa salina TaxID=215803 RepID=A0A2S9YIS8_9BACT|nr:ECF RNA polymerase sigma-E factor [Enhygromyxa salina]